YAYGLTQARSSFHTSQRFAGLGTVVLLFGIALAIWRSETTGDLYLGIVTSSVGAVIALIGQLFHRRADIALRHMTEQTEALREDMRTERSTEQAIMLLANVVDPEVKARLQAGLIMKLSGSKLPALSSEVHLPPQRESEQPEAKGSSGT
ncbi:TRADD-N-associated membrane domain-containing protein, partial [Streptomyces sp. C10-9-1]|uniref:TRADD-N-associated membrane domain-containing protein n=1 Tax=Streptomyces sp. C10-9-1 TaxID=1859285 RepID=UPI003D729FC3